jgi:acetylornithine deacetylase/succinyl-diaminopimelate desuccinylase-like protein
VQRLLPQLHADGAIVTEPTELAVGVAHKGFVWVEIQVTGVAAHGSRPELGVDAIVRTGPVLVLALPIELPLRNVRRAGEPGDRPRPASGSVPARTPAQPPGSPRGRR